MNRLAADSDAKAAEIERLTQLRRLDEATIVRGDVCEACMLANSGVW